MLLCVYVASVTLTPLERNNSRVDIECPGDTISYNCSIWSNSETVQLTWRVTLPGEAPMVMTYDGSSSLNTVDNLGMDISTILTSYMSDQYIASSITLTILRGVPMNGSLLECFTERLDDDSDTIYVNSSGIH